MTEEVKADAARTQKLLRIWAVGIGIVATLFWLYTFYGIAQVPAGDGTGFQWIGVMPLGFFYFVFCVPALVLAWKGRALWLALVFGAVGLIGLLWIWSELLQEFYH